MSKVALARKYRDHYGMEMPTRKLARIMYSENPLMFKNDEDARWAVRAIEGKVKTSGVKQTHLLKGDRPKNPYKIPESSAEERLPFKLPLACNNILLISDLHIPYHDVNAITAAIDYGIENKVNCIFINGDLIDNHHVSRWERNPHKRDQKYEFDCTKEFLRVLRKCFPEAEIYWMKGNHCTRWEKFLLQKACEIWDDPYFSLEERLRLNEERVKLLDDKTLVKAGKLAITHGHHIFKGIFTPASPARGAFNKAKQSVIVGHLHRSSEHPEVDLEGNMTTCWTTGCLCELKPDYSPLASNANHGFAHITIEKNENFHVKNMKIINGKIY